MVYATPLMTIGRPIHDARNKDPLAHATAVPDVLTVPPGAPVIVEFTEGMKIESPAEIGMAPVCITKH